MATTNQAHAATPAAPAPPLTAFERPEPFPEPNTPEWDVVNSRRCRLIERDLDGVLTDAERAELAWLQKRCREAVNRKFPPPLVVIPGLDL